jgi:putative ABC transport system permease protein
MTLLAFRNLITEKTRFAFSAAGIGFAVFLITILLGLYQGWNSKVGAFVDDVEADVWVMRLGTTDFIAASSILGADLGEQLGGREDVTSVQPLMVRPMSFYKGDKKVDVQLIGYDTTSGIGGPTKIIKGTGDLQGAQMVVDDVLSRIYNVNVGDTLTSSGKSVEIVGISTGGNFAFTQAGFMSIEGSRELLDLGDLSTFFVVSLRDRATAQHFADDVMAENPTVTVYTSGEFSSATRHRILDNVIPIIGLILGLAFIVGIAITSLTIYTATVERTREFGVMKAIGFNNRDLYKLVLGQSLITGLLGFVFGAALTLLVSSFIDRIVAQFIIVVRPIDIAFVLLATLGMAFASAIVPARRVGGIDPAVVFRG